MWWRTPRKRNQNSESRFRTFPFHGMPFAMTTSKALSRSVVTMSSVSPRSKMSRTLPLETWASPGSSQRVTTDSGIGAADLAGVAGARQDALELALEGDDDRLLAGLVRPHRDAGGHASAAGLAPVADRDVVLATGVDGRRHRREVGIARLDAEDLEAVALRRLHLEMQHRRLRRRAEPEVRRRHLHAPGDEDRD